MAIVTINKKVKPTQLEYHLLQRAREGAQLNQPVARIQGALDYELADWKANRQKYRHAGTTVSLLLSGTLRVSNQDDQAVFTVS